MSTKLTAAEKKQAAAEQAAAEQAAAEQAAAEQAAEQAAAEQAAAEQAAAEQAAAKPALRRRRASNIKAVRATAGDVLVCGTLRITREGVELGKVSNKMMKHIEYGIAVGTLEQVK